VLFEVPGFDRVTTDGFFLAVGASDPRFDAARTARELNETSPISIVRFPTAQTRERET
jgi:hypothetical protein